MRNLLLLLGIIGVFAIRASDLPPLQIPEGVGVNIHFVRGHEKDLELIAAGGFRFIRMDFGWASIERKKGEYNWSDYDELTANLEKHQLRAIYILDYSNPLYEEPVESKNPLYGNAQRDTASPQHPESVEAFAKWAAAAAKHYAGRKIIWEIWNEPNISFWKPKPNAEQYRALAVATAKAVRQADPKATIIGPATSEVPIKWIEEVFATGLLADLDAVSVHPYRPYKKGPETAVEDYVKFRALIDRSGKNPKEQRLPIISGEWGYSTFTKGVSEETQAAYIVRQQLANLLEEIPITIWYDWKNDGPDRAEREHNFGTVREDLSPKPAYTALKTMTTALSGFKIEKRLGTGNTNDFLILLSNKDNAKKVAAWTMAETRTVLVEGGIGHIKEASGISALGEKTEPKVENEKIAIHLTAMPQFITLGY